MTASHVLDPQQSNACAGMAGQVPRLLAAGSTHSLRPAAPIRLHVVRGRAWVTLGAEALGDVVLHPGQSVCVAAGRRAVVEPLGGEPLCYQWQQVGRASCTRLRPGLTLVDAARRVSRRIMACLPAGMRSADMC